jgi:hypothetical protein
MLLNDLSFIVIYDYYKIVIFKAFGANAKA